MKAIDLNNEEDSDINLYFLNYVNNQNEKLIDLIEQCVKHQFPDIKNLEVSLNQVKYDDDRYSLEEVTEFVMSLYKPQP